LSVPSDRGLKTNLRLHDLVLMQILLVVGIPWVGIAARQGETHVVFWLAGILLFFLPSAAVVSFCAKLWPDEGGVYQWVTHAMGPFTGFLSAWNLCLWALLTVSNVGIVTATSLSYALGPQAAWMAGSHMLIAALTLGLFVVILLINLRGLALGRWVSHFGTLVTVGVTLLLGALLVWHPHTSAIHPHVSPQRPFSLALPLLTLMSLNLFSKIAFHSLGGLEQVAVFAGETHNPSTVILQSAWIAAPICAFIYILMTGSLLTYIPAMQVDLAGPIPQVLSAAFAGTTPAAGSYWGVLLSRGVILVLAIALIAQYVVIVAQASRLPMVAGWKGVLPPLFTQLHPRW
jgi:amino acid transporter